MADLLRLLTDLLAPRACTACGCRLAAGEDVLCTGCNIRLPRTHFARSPLDNEMARLFWGRVPVERCAALFFYHPHSASGQMIYGLKYRGRAEDGRMLGRLAAGEMAAEGFFDGMDLLIPLPLARRRERERGYNQSAMIAEGVAEITRLRVERHAVERTRDTPSQTTMERSRRSDNVEGAFRLRDPERVSGHHVLLIDDITTTGATLAACARVLLGAGGVTVSVLTLGFSKS